MRTARTLGILALFLIVASPAFAADGEKKPAAPKDTVTYYNTIDRTLNPVTLTDEQKTKFDALKKEYQQKFTDAYAKVDVLTPEQKKAGDEARKAAKAEGKNRKEVNKAVADAVKLTDEQKEKAKEARAALKSLQGEFKGKVMDLLTDEQKQKIKDAAKSKKPAKGAKAAK